MNKFFIEIGTADFDTFEHLAEKGWKGIFVEPVKELLNNLKRYDDCVYEDCAILDKMDTMMIKYYDPEWALEWIRGLGSMNSMNHFNANPQWKEHERSREVEVVTLDYLIEKHNVKSIDYLKIDIEGWEYRILDNYSWKILPKELKVEYAHWHNNNIDYKVYVKKLEKMGYNVTVMEEDLLCKLNSTIDHIYVVWHREEYRKVMEEKLSGIDKPVTYIGPDPNGQDPRFSKWMYDNNYKAIENWKIEPTEYMKKVGLSDWWGRDIKNGELACAINHINAWKQAKLDNSQCALFLEQDAYVIGMHDSWWDGKGNSSHPDEGAVWIKTDLKDTISQKVENYITSMKDVDWDMLYLGMCGDIQTENTEIEGIQKTKWSYCASSYILRPKGINIALETDIEQNLVPIDDYLAALYAPSNYERVHPNLQYLSGRLKAYNVARVEGLSLIKQYHGDKKIVWSGNEEVLCEGGISDTENSPLHVPFKQKTE